MRTFDATQQAVLADAVEGAIVREPALYPSQLNPDVPREFNNITARALAKKRHCR